MIYDVVEQAYTVTAANFTADLAALATLKGVSIDSSVTFAKRMRAETYRALNVATPTMGIVAIRAQTGAKEQNGRDSTVVVEWDYYAEATDESGVVRLGKQAELVAEAVLRSIDRLAESGGGVFGAGELPLSVTVDLSEGVEIGEAKTFWRSVIVTAPVHDRDITG